MEHPILDFINKARKRFEMVGAGPPCVRIVVASVFHKNITGSGKLDISEALS